MTRTFLIALCGLASAAPTVAHAQTAVAPPAVAVQATVANPARLRASELLARREAGVAPRVLFEWDHVPGAREYVLQGRWVDTRTWGLETREYRVNAQNAREWTSARVTFDLSLPRGSHSWTVVAVFGQHDVGDFARPTHVAFDLGGTND